MEIIHNLSDFDYCHAHLFGGTRTEKLKACERQVDLDFTGSDVEFAIKAGRINRPLKAAVSRCS